MILIWPIRFLFLEGWVIIPEGSLFWVVDTTSHFYAFSLSKYDFSCDNDIGNYIFINTILKNEGGDI